MSDLARSAVAALASLTTPAGQKRAAAALRALQARRVTFGVVSRLFGGRGGRLESDSMLLPLRARFGWRGRGALAGAGSAPLHFASRA